MKQSKSKKPVSSMKDWVKKTCNANIINNAINLFILGGIYYLLVGNGKTHDLVITNIGFLFLYIPYYMIYVSEEAIKNSRVAFLKNKWIVSDGETVDSTMPIKSIWRQITPESLVLGVLAAIAGSMALWLLGNSPYLIYIAITYAFAITYVLTNIILKRHLAKDLSAFVAEHARASQETANTVSFWKYFTIHYIVPWSIIIVYLNLILGLKGNFEVALIAENMGQVPATKLLMFDVLIWVFVALAWPGSIAMSQVIPDFHLHRVFQERRAMLPAKQKRDVLVILVLLFAVPLAATGITFVIVPISGIKFITVTDYVAISLVILEISSIPGLYFGMVFGVALDVLKSEYKPRES